MVSKWILAATVLFPLAAPAAAPRFRVGEPVPDVYLPTMKSGELRSLASFAGRKVLLLHFASW